MKFSSSFFGPAPLFDEVTIVNEQGEIRISWTFVHTGGLDITAIEAFCNIEDGASGSGYDLMSVLSCEMDECVSQSLMGSTTLRMVEACTSYTCVVTAFNANGSDTEERSNITSNIG